MNRMDIRYLQGYKFVDQDKQYPKEACDVRTHYSILFPLSSNQNYQPERQPPGNCRPYSGKARQAISANLPRMWQACSRSSQLGPTQNSRSEHGCHSAVGDLSLSQSVLCALSRHSYRGFGSVSSLSSCDASIGQLCLPTVPCDDRIGSRTASESGLENGQKHRQILSGTRLRTTRLKGVADFSRGRNIDPKGPQLPDSGSGLP